MRSFAPSNSPLLVCLLRPDGTTLWVSEAVAYAMGVKHGQTLTPDKLQHPDLLSYQEKKRQLAGGRSR